MDDLFRLLFRTVDVTPDYEPRRCLAVIQSREACTRCRDVCPHDAIRIDRRVEIDEVDCSGCGLCVQVCPSQALEARPSFAPGAALKCSRVRGDTQTVHCLGRLAPSDLLRLAGGRPAVTLARGDCAACPIGAAAVADAIEVVRAEAQELAATADRALEIRVVETERLDRDDAPERLSRRQLLRGGWRQVQRGAATALAPLDPGDPRDDSLPREMQRRYRVLELADLAPETPVPWVLPRVAEGCILCPVCTNVCPTRAFARDFDRDGTGEAALVLEPERCVGCGACASACPVHVIELVEEVPWGELAGGPVEAYRREPDAGGPEGSVAR